MNDITRVRDVLKTQEQSFRRVILEVRQGITHPKVLVDVVTELTVLLPLWIALGNARSGSKLCGAIEDVIEHAVGWNCIEHIRRSAIVLKVEFDRAR